MKKRWEARAIERNRMSRIRFDYLHFPPSRLEGGLPLVVYLHGAGQKGSSLEALARCSLPSLLDEGLDLPATVVCPLAKAGPGWPITHLAIFIEEAIRHHNADPRRVYVTGESMGGRGVFELAYWHPDLVAAIAPLCGFGIPNLAPLLRDVPVWMFHGTADEVLPIARSDEMSAALETAGANARLSRLEGEGHSIGLSTYRRAELWEWMFAQARSTSYLAP